MNKLKTFSFGYSIFIGLIIAAFIKLFIIEFLVVDGISMEPTIKNHQTIIINKLSYGLQNPFGSKLLIHLIFLPLTIYEKYFLLSFSN